MQNYQNKFIYSFEFYAAYHQNPINQIVHMITIPLIMFTILAWLAYWTPYQIQTSNEIVTNLLSFNIGLILIAIYATIYIVLNIIGGLLYVPVLLVLYGSANLVRFYVPYAWLICIGIHIIAWVFQFMGHGIWEKRKPALFDSLIQAFVMAPFFVFMELLFKCGYNKDLQDKINYQMQFYREDTENLI